MEDTRFSLAKVFNLRSEAFAEIREHTAAVDRLATALGDLDAAMTCCIDERNIDEQQALVTAARQLSDAMGGGAA